jgi:hypothetical protein
VVPTHLEAIEDVVFDTMGLGLGEQESGLLRSTSGAVDPQFGADLGIAGAQPAGGTPEAVAATILQHLGAFIREMATVHQVRAAQGVCDVGAACGVHGASASGPGRL